MKKLIAKLLNLDLVAVPFAFEHEERFVRRDADGQPYVRLYGTYRHLDESGYFGRKIIWLHRAAQGKPDEQS
jgi:hypothetical protein